MLTYLFFWFVFSPIVIFIFIYSVLLTKYRRKFFLNNSLVRYFQEKYNFKEIGAGSFETDYWSHTVSFQVIHHRSVFFLNSFRWIIEFEPENAKTVKECFRDVNEVEVKSEWLMWEIKFWLLMLPDKEKVESSLIQKYSLLRECLEL
jgi:MFS-type transporter involved in bile tolerance (Atg22 family)